MSAVVSILFVMSTATAARDLSHVRLSISTDRSTYYVGEPLSLDIEIENNGSEPVVGYFSISTHTPHVRIQYRRRDEPFKDFRVQRLHAEEVFVVQSPVRLPGGRGRSGRIVMSINPQDDRFVLADPGEYEIRVLYSDPGMSGRSLESNTVAVTATSTPPHEAAAARQYSGVLAQLAQFDPVTTLEPDDTTISEARRLIEDYPQSAYARAVREGLLRALGQQVRRGRKEHLDLYKKLKLEQN